MSRIFSGENEIQVKKQSQAQGIILLKGWLLKAGEEKCRVDRDQKGDLSDAGCRSLTVLFKEGLIQSLHYPENYSDLAACSWVFQAPRRYLIKLSFQNLEIEESGGDCTSNYVAVHRDVERKKEIARLCGFAAPAPVLSSSGVMFISFQSDENVTFRGFQATVSFIPETDVNISGSEDEPMFLETWSTI
ncbi:Ovochymase-2 [Manis pentadactyla]|nr:Ovochymase-2 [Manis pentadactyla]